MSKKKNRLSNEPDASSDGPFTFSTDPLVSEIQRKIVEIFEIFDVAGQKTVDVREVGTMSRALDLYPTEADVHEIIGHVEEPKGLVKFNTFVNHMTKVICEGKYKPVSYAEFTKALRSLDREKKGTLDPNRLKKLLMREGEPFTAEEVEEMWNFAVSKEDGLIHWEEYADKVYRGIGGA